MGEGGCSRSPKGYSRFIGLPWTCGRGHLLTLGRGHLELWRGHLDLCLGASRLMAGSILTLDRGHLDLWQGAS